LPFLLLEEKLLNKKKEGQICPGAEKKDSSITYKALIEYVDTGFCNFHNKSDKIQNTQSFIDKFLNIICWGNKQSNSWLMLGGALSTSIIEIAKSKL
jgi:hypothetical protein